MMTSVARCSVFCFFEQKSADELSIMECSSFVCPPDLLVIGGGWERPQVLFDDGRSRLTDPADTGMAQFDMATRTERRIAGTGREDQPYAVSADSGTLIWATRNRCGEEYLAVREPDAPERFCLAAMTGQ